MVLKMSDCSQCEYPGEYPALFWSVYYNGRMHACSASVIGPEKGEERLKGRGLGNEITRFPTQIVVCPMDIDPLASPFHSGKAPS